MRAVDSTRSESLRSPGQGVRGAGFIETPAQRIETGLPQFRVTTNGYSAVIDANGTVIASALIGLVIAGISVFVFAGFGPITYWIGGLALCLFVGPAQASSRTFVARFTPHGREGEVFGLYQTTGRAASFLSPSAWLISVSIATASGVANPALFGVIGLVFVIGVGLYLLMQVEPNPRVLNDLQDDLAV